MKKLLLALLLLPALVFGQSTGKIMSNRSSNSTLPVDSINANSKLNLAQTSPGITLIMPNKTTMLTTGTTMYVHNIGSVSVTLSVSGLSSVVLAVNEFVIYDWIGNKWTLIKQGSGSGGSFLPLAGGTVQDSSSVKAISTVARLLYDETGVNLFSWNSNGISLNKNGAYLNLNGNAIRYSQAVTDPNNVVSAFFLDRWLVDSVGGSNISINWNRRQLFKAGGTVISLDWQKFLLKGVWSTTDTFKIGNNSNAFVGKLFSNGLSANRKYLLPDSSGTFALTSAVALKQNIISLTTTGINGVSTFTSSVLNIPNYTTTASNGITKSTADFQLGGTLSSNTTINGGGSRSLTLGGVGSKLTDLLANASNSVYLKAVNAAGTLLLQSSSSGIYHTDFSTTNSTIEGNQNNTFLNWTNLSYTRTLSLDTNGIGFETTGNTHYGYFKTSHLTSANRLFQLPDSSGTLALLTNIPATITASNGLTKTGNNIALGGSITGSTTIALGSQALLFTKSGNTLWSANTGGLYDNNSPSVQSIDLFNRLLYDASGNPVLTYSNSGTSGVGITRVGNNTFVAYLKNSLLSGSDKTYQFPNISDTLITRHSTETLYNKSFVTPNIGSATGSISGNAGTATKLITGRSIIITGDVSYTSGLFDGSSNVNGTGTVTAINGTSLSALPTGLLKNTISTGIPSIAVPGTDYAIPLIISADATDADFTAVVNSVKYLPVSTLTTNRNIIIPSGTNGDRIDFYNNESVYSWNLTGVTVYLADRSTVVTSLLYNFPAYLKYISGKWIIAN